MIAQTASSLAGTSPSMTVLVNGGQIANDDVERSVQVGRRVVVVAGSGRPPMRSPAPWMCAPRRTRTGIDRLGSHQFRTCGSAAA